MTEEMRILADPADFAAARGALAKPGDKAEAFATIALDVFVHLLEGGTIRVGDTRYGSLDQTGEPE